jgi:hypothetical protein
MKGAAVFFVLVVIALGINWTCSNGHATQVEPKGAPDGIELDRFEITFDVKENAYAKIPAIRVHRGGTIMFTAATGTAFFLFPDKGLGTVVDGVDMVAGGPFVAFKVGDGRIGVLKVPRGFPDSKNDVEIPYSVLACTGEGIGMKCQYVEGKSPPKIIIPPSGP